MTVMQDSSALVLEEGTNPGLPFLNVWPGHVLNLSEP